MLHVKIFRLYGVVLLFYMLTGASGYPRIRRQLGSLPTSTERNCVKLTDCEDFFNLLKQKPVPSSVFEELRRRNCGYDGTDPKILCPSQTVNTSPTPTFTPSITVTSSGLSAHPNLKLLPLKDCGQSLDDRVFGGKNAFLGAFPWMAGLGYLDTRRGKLEYRCGGALINSRYVLTAAHCVTNLKPHMKLQQVRLGEHDTSSEIDCEIDFCADPPQDFGIEEIKFHEDYNSPNNKNENDIALLRLDHDANYTYTVNSICLPFGTLRNSTYLNHPSQPRVAGWGRTETKLGSEILQQVQIPIVPQEDCSTAYRQLSNNRNISPTQLCAGEARKDSCGGDSGGPLMITEQNPLPQYIIIGVVSFGPSLCGHPDIPGVYTRVGSYLIWILDNLQS